MSYQDRSDRVRWLLEEMQTPYTDHFLDKKKGDLETVQYKKLNPMGRVPTIVDGENILWESAAICMYLADKYSYGHLAPTLEKKELRAQYIKWMFYSVGTLECVIARMFTHTNNPEEEKSTHLFVKEQSSFFKLALNPILEKQNFILSSGFSTADIMLGAIIPGAHEYLVKGNLPLEKYMERLMNRDAAKKAKVF